MHLFFFFSVTATAEIYTLSLHDALPISHVALRRRNVEGGPRFDDLGHTSYRAVKSRSEEHTSELQSRFDLVCRLLLEKKKKNVGMMLFFLWRTGQLMVAGRQGGQKRWDF